MSGTQLFYQGNIGLQVIIKHYHEKGFHVAGTNQTLADLSSKYWIVSGREAVREWENQCMECRRRKGKPVSQIMSPLLEIRLRKPLKAFAQVAVDFGGPYITIQGRGKKKREALSLSVYLFKL